LAVSTLAEKIVLVATLVLLLWAANRQLGVSSWMPRERAEQLKVVALETCLPRVVPWVIAVFCAAACGLSPLERKIFFKQMLDWIDRVRPTEHAFQFFDEASKAHGTRSRGFFGYLGYFHPLLRDRKSFIEDLRKLLRLPG
jgi:hypothetical protein